MTQEGNGNEDIAFEFKAASQPITLDRAREYHINYLETGPWIEANVGGSVQKVHSFIIERDDLETLHTYGTHGVRLYFCKENAGQAYVNIIAVPVITGGDLDVKSDIGGGYPPIINTLEPCPNICPPAFTEHDLNCRKKTGGDFYWLKPNHAIGGNAWFKANDMSVAHPKPSPPYDE